MTIDTLSYTCQRPFFVYNHIVCTFIIIIIIYFFFTALSHPYCFLSINHYFISYFSWLRLHYVYSIAHYYPSAFYISIAISCFFFTSRGNFSRQVSVSLNQGFFYRSSFFFLSIPLCLMYSYWSVCWAAPKLLFI